MDHFRNGQGGSLSVGISILILISKQLAAFYVKQVDVETDSLCGREIIRKFCVLFSAKYTALRG